MINAFMDLKMLMLAIGFWTALVLTEKQLSRQDLNPWDDMALKLGGWVATIGSVVTSLGFCVISFSLLMR